MSIVKFEALENRLIRYKDEYVLVDSDIAQLYGVETRDINKAVKNNPDKFPDGYIIELTKEDKNELVEKFHQFDRLKHSTASPKVFTEKGFICETRTDKVKRFTLLELEPEILCAA